MALYFPSPIHVKLEEFISELLELVGNVETEVEKGRQGAGDSTQMVSIQIESLPLKLGSSASLSCVPVTVPL